MFSYKLFRSAGTTGHVFTHRRGRAHDRGVGWSGIISPTMTVAIVPTTIQGVDYAVEAYTSDRQLVRVSGSVQISFVANVARTVFDFTVSRDTGGYTAKWQNDLQSAITDQILGPIREVSSGLTVEAAVGSQALFEKAIRAAMETEGGPQVKRGIQIQTSSVNMVTPSSSDVLKAIGAEQREALLTQSDAAIALRRQNAAASERELQQFEAETKLSLEKQRANLVAQEGENKVAAATSEAEANRVRLTALDGLDASKVLGAAFLEAAQRGSLTDVSLTTELLTLLRDASKGA